MRSCPMHCFSFNTIVVAQVRDYEFDQEIQDNQGEAAKTLKANADSKRSQMEQWSASAYGEVRNCITRLIQKQRRLQTCKRKAV